MNLIALNLAGPFPFAQLTLKVTLLLAMFFGLWMLARNKSASFRHSILVLALISLPCLAVAQFLLPSKSLPWLEQQAVAKFEGAFEYSGRNKFGDAEIAANSTVEKLLPQNDLLLEPHSEAPGVTDSPQSSQSPGVSFWSARKILLAIWIGGSTLLIIRFTVAWLVVWRHVRQCEEIDVEGLCPTLKSLVSECKNVGCEVRMHREAEQMPLCFGIFRSTILLPQEFAQWSFKDQQSVILHESAHAHRRDCLVNVLAHFENAVLWFHPLSWLLLRYLRSESEMACDDWAIAKGVDSVNYASALFDVTMATRRKPTVAVVSVSMADCSPLERRMQSILSPSVPRKPISLISHILVSAASIAAIVFLAGFHLSSSAEAQNAMEVEHRIDLNDNKMVRGTLMGTMDLETTYGSAKLNFANVRSIKPLNDGRHQVLAEDGTVLKGIISQASLRLSGVDHLESVDVSRIKKITTIGNANLVPERITSGFLKDNISYHIRAPKGYDPAESYPAIVFFHPSDSNTKPMLDDFVATHPGLADRMLLIGLNGENKSTNIEGGFNYTFVDFMGRSKHKGFAGKDRESPALVTEAITDLKDRIPISATYVIGEGDGAFLAFSVMMNYAEMIDGVIAINGGFLTQTYPSAYEDEELIAAQRATPITLLNMTRSNNTYVHIAQRELLKAKFSSTRLYEVKNKRALPKIYERTFRGFEKKNN